jgi:hypothetical protein
MAGLGAGHMVARRARRSRGRSSRCTVAAKAWPSDGKTHKHYINAPAWVVLPVVELGVVESFTTPAGPDI